MNPIGITMRSDLYEPYQEQRDGLDRRWYDFLILCQLQPILLPNHSTTLELIRQLRLKNFILTGGSSFGTNTPERDLLEFEIIKYAQECSAARVMGVCRGMQVIQSFFGGFVPAKITGHVGTRHDIIFQSRTVSVNSYHNFGAKHIPEGFSVEAIACDDGTIEAIRHKTSTFYGIMWHPEREAPFSQMDIQLFREYFEVTYEK